MNMILLQGNALARRFGGETLFEGVSFSVQERSRLSLVGHNGAGKSTLLKIIMGVEEASSGEISCVKGLSIGYLAQDAGLDSQKAIFDEMLTVFSHLTTLEKRLSTLTESLSSANDKMLADYDRLSETFRAQGGYTYETEIKSVLNGFGFPEVVWDMKISSLSGGQKTRLALAKLLLETPQLLILDEPTNHLDIETLGWLENYLKNYKGALLIVSHDRYFLDKVATETLELARGHLTHFAGNYSAYMEEKAILVASQQKEFDKQQKTIEKLEDFVAKNLVRASTTKRAQSRRKQLEKMERLEAPLGEQKSAHILFDPEKVSGQEVLQVENAAIGYEKTLSAPINLNVKKQDAIAIVGPNGIGKTTLIQSIIGEIPFLSGQAKLGAQVTVGYYDQTQEKLDRKEIVLEELWKAHRLLPEVVIRRTLGAFLFSGDDVMKTVGMLSGGEKARLLLAKLAMAHDNFLILDEPTNHLDIDSREVLEQALIDFSGTLLFVSHDRYFINRVATKVLEITATGSTLYLGDYDYYLQKKANAVAVGVDEKPIRSDNREEFKGQQREKRRLERRIAELEVKLEEIDQQETEITAEMAANLEDYELLADWQHTLDRLEKENAAFEEELLELLEKIEKM